MLKEHSRLDDALRESMPPEAFKIPGGRGLFMEINDTTTGLVSMATSTVTFNDYSDLKIAPPLQKAGVGHAAMDRAVFLSSPGSNQGEVLHQEIGGWDWINVAKPMEIIPPDTEGGPLRISVDKAHVIGFEADRSVSVLRLPHGDYVELVGESTFDEQLILPRGGALERIDLKRPWIVTLPSPTDTYFWLGKSMRSFQGPITLP